MSETRLKPALDDLFSQTQKKKLTLIEFDDMVTARFGGSSPPFPFSNAKEYYKYGTSHNRLGEVRVPLLAFNADDDPCVALYPTEWGGNGLVAVVATAGGGHLGWFEHSEDGKIRRWVTKPVIEWLRAVVEDLEPPEFKLREIVQDGEWTTEEGHENLGFKVLGDGGEIEGAEGEGGLFAGL